MPKLNGRLPHYRLHRASGQAIVTLNGHDHYLGPHGSQTSIDAYDQLVAEWLTAGRRAVQSEQSQSAPTIDHIILAFWQHAQVHYRRRNGTATSELENFRQALRPLRRLYGATSPLHFGPKALKAVREQMMSQDWCRGNINKQISRIKSVFRWAVEEELIPVEIHQALLAVKGLQRGRTTARETDPVKPVPEGQIESVKPFVSRQIWALIQLQLLTGARVGELLRLRGIDLKTSEQVWTADLEEHKTAHHGRNKRIYFGPQAQEILKAFVRDRPLNQFLFNAKEAAQEHRQERHLNRKTALSCGNVPGSNRQSAPKRSPQDCYTVDSYRKAIVRACDSASPPSESLARRKVRGSRGLRWESISEWRSRLGCDRWAELCVWREMHRWCPLQLRHNAATFIRREFGIDLARVILGHRSVTTTEIYAEIDDQKAVNIMQKIG
jgi:integrase